MTNLGLERLSFTADRQEINLPLLQLRNIQMLTTFSLSVTVPHPARRPSTQPSSPVPLSISSTLRGRPSSFLLVSQFKDFITSLPSCYHLLVRGAGPKPNGWEQAPVLRLCRSSDNSYDASAPFSLSAVF